MSEFRTFPFRRDAAGVPPPSSTPVTDGVRDGLDRLTKWPSPTRSHNLWVRRSLSFSRSLLSSISMDTGCVPSLRSVSDSHRTPSSHPDPCSESRKHYPDTSSRPRNVGVLTPVVPPPRSGPLPPTPTSLFGTRNPSLPESNGTETVVGRSGRAGTYTREYQV